MKSSAANSLTSPHRFVDETWDGDTLMRVEHHVEATADDECPVVYAIYARGSDAEAIGEAVSADFPDALAGLEKYLAGRAAT